jgi:DNA-binding transcriptional MerR regulator
MRQTSKVEGTKIAQAAKDFNVTSMTIRRYLSKFNIDTTTDENGIKVLPDIAMEELKEVRKLKDDGLTDPKILEILEERRSNQGKSGSASAQAKAGGSKSRSGAKAKAHEEDEGDSLTQDEAEEEKESEKRRGGRRAKAEPAEPSVVAEDLQAASESAEEGQATVEVNGVPGQSKAKHSLTCQTCGKVFEHMNPRLRDCLDCYRTKRKERRRGGSDKHKNVIQHPLAQQVANKSAQNAQQNGQYGQGPANGSSVSHQPTSQPVAALVTHNQTPLVQKGPVRNYRKAIEETRQITGSLKRRLERPDLPEGERRWLEQIYAYQLILHQGWRHLSDYKAASQPQGKGED